MTPSQAHLGCMILKACLGREGKRFNDQIQFFLTHNGMEWTVNRLKTIYQVSLLLRDGRPGEARKLLQTNSISYHKDTMYPVGIEGVVVRRAVEAQRTAVLKRAYAALRYYTLITYDKLTPSQERKAWNAIYGRSTTSMSWEELFDYGYSCTEQVLAKRGLEPGCFSLEKYPLQQDEIHAEHLHGTSCYYSRNKLPKLPRWYHKGEFITTRKGRRVLAKVDGYQERPGRETPFASMAMSFMTEPYVPEVLDKLVPCYEMRMDIRSQEGFSDECQKYFGKVMEIQERGGKLRSAIQPSAWLQLAFAPLHYRLEWITKQLFPKEVVSKYQPSGAWAMLSQAERGIPVACSDLSSATDRFPAAFSVGVLAALGLGEYAVALTDVLSNKKLLWLDGKTSDYMGVGQPMGLYGSFPLFQLSHCIVAELSYETTIRRPMSGPFKKEEFVFKDGSPFKIVGDDIVFANQALMDDYNREMTQLGVEISSQKSFENHVCEFAGFLGFETNKGYTVFRPFKYPKSGTPNAIQLMGALGTRTKTLNKPYWLRVWAAFQRTLPRRDLDYSPLVPEGYHFTEKGMEKDRFANANAGDNRTLMSMCQMLALRTNDLLPDLSGDPHINREPLFREGPATMLRPHYDPRAYRLSDSGVARRPSEAYAKSIKDDPLLQEELQMEDDFDLGI